MTFRDGPLFFLGGGEVVTFFVKKLFAGCSWLKKIVCFKGKNCLQSKGIFFEIHRYFKILTQIGLDINVSFSFI